MLPTATDDHPPPLGLGQLPHPTTMAHPDLGQPYHPWSQLVPNYHYRSPLALGDDGSDMTTGQYIEEMPQETSPHLLLEAHHTTHHFHSTPQLHPPPRQRPSPPMQQPSPIPASDPTQDPTTRTATTTSTVNEEMFARIALAGGPVHLAPQHMSTAPSHDPSLDGSPSWNSAMTPLMNQQLDHLYHYQAQRQHSVPLAQPPLPDSYPAHPSLLSTTAHRPHSPQQNLSAGGAHRYSQELRRQQEEQMRRIQLQAQYQDEQARERMRRKSEEEELMRLHMDGYHDASQRPSPPHAPQYYPAYAGDMALQDAQELDHLALGMADGAPYPHHPQAAYRLPLALPPESLKYESRLE